MRSRRWTIALVVLAALVAGGAWAGVAVHHYHPRPRIIDFPVSSHRWPEAVRCGRGVTEGATVACRPATEDGSYEPRRFTLFGPLEPGAKVSHTDSEPGAVWIRCRAPANGVLRCARLDADPVNVETALYTITVG